MNETFYKISVIQDFLLETAKQRQQLIDELIDNATDPVIKMRRIRMLHQLSDYESQIIKTIDRFEPDDNYDMIPLKNILHGLFSVVNRSA